MNEPTLEMNKEPDIMDAFDKDFNAKAAVHDKEGNVVAPAVPEPVATPAPVKPEPKPEKIEPVEPPRSIEGLDDLPMAPKKAAKVEAAKKEVEFDPEKAPIQEFRKVYTTTKQERDALKKRADELEAQLKSLPQVDEQKIRAEYTKKENEYQQRVREYEEKLRFHDYSQTQEYKEKYELPWNEAQERVQEDLKGVMVLDGETEREANLRDVGELLNVNTVQANRRAKELFGDAAPIFMQHRQELLRLRNSANKAQNEWKEKGSQFQTQQQENERQHRERVIGLYQDEIKRYRDTAPEFFGEESGDDEGNQILNKFEPVVNLALKGEGLPEGLTPQQRSERIVKAQANVAMRAIAFGRERLRNVRLAKQVEELTEKLKSYEKSEPNPTDNAIGAAPKEKALWDGIDDIV